MLERFFDQPIVTFLLGVGGGFVLGLLFVSKITAMAARDNVQLRNEVDRLKARIELIGERRRDA